jgi:hypothetical protein
MFNLATGSFVGYRTDEDGSDGNSITDIGGGRYRISLTFTTSASPVSTLFGAQVGLSSDGTLNFESATTTADNIKVYKAQVELGATATPYQKVTAAYDITETGVADRVGLLFDGVDDFLVSPSIDLTGTDEATMSAAGTISAATTANTRFIAHNAEGASGVSEFYYQADADALRLRSGGTTLITREVSGESGTQPFSAIGRTEIPAPRQSIQVNGTENVGTGSLGTGNFANAPLYIGSRTNLALFSNCHIHSALLIDRYITEEEITGLEKTLANQVRAIPELTVTVDNVSSLSGELQVEVDY